MKTAMQELIDDLKKNNPHHYQDNKDWFNSLLEKEKQQIIDSATHGANFDKSPFKNAQDYYDSTFVDSNQAGI